MPTVEHVAFVVGDTEWIPIVGARGWIMVTSDKRIRTRPLEANMAIQHRLKVIHLQGAAGHQTAWDQAVRFLTRWSAIEAHVTATPEGPWWLSIRRDSTAPLSYEPGRVERS